MPSAVWTSGRESAARLFSKASLRLVRRSLPTDLSAGVAAGIASIPQSMSMGALALSPLGPSWAAVGMASGLCSAAVGGAIASLCGGSKLLLTGPRASASHLVASMAALLAADPAAADPAAADPAAASHGGAAGAFAVLMAACLAAACLQIAAGAFRFGRFVHLVPRPVLSGFSLGMAALILLSQFPTMGLSGAGLAAAPLTIALATAVVMKAWPKKPAWPLLSAPIAALSSGILLGWALILLCPSLPPAPAVGAVPLWTDSPWPSLSASLADGWLWSALRRMALPIATLALVCSTDSLMGAVAVDAMLGTRHDGDKELVGQGLANAAGSLLGAIPGTGSFARASVAIRAGAKGKAAAMAAAAVALLALPAAPLLAFVPAAAFAGIMLVVAVDLVDPWIRTLCLQLKDKATRHDAAVDLTAVAIVALCAVAFDVITAVAAGMALSLVAFVRRASRPVVARTVLGSQRRSLAPRSQEQASILDRASDRIVVLGLEGPLFFGTGSGLVRDILLESDGRSDVVLDMRKAQGPDASAARSIQQAARLLGSKGKRLRLAPVLGLFGLSCGKVQPTR